jgi:uncharacterized membrane protein YcfT
MSTPELPPTAVTLDRYGWLDFAKGLCIVSVVWMWTDKYLELDSGWFHYYARFSLPFRMPDFFLISGLLLGRVINRPWRNYIDTRVVHYLYFLVVWTLIYIPLSWLAEAPESLGAGLLEVALAIVVEPKGNLWFLQMLALYFLFTRLTARVPTWIVLPLAVGVYLYPLKSGIFALELFGDHFVFFYCGYFLAPYILSATRWIQEHKFTSTLALAAWVIGNFIIMVWFEFKLGDNRGVGLALRFVGIAGVISFSALVWKASLAQWLNYIGRNSIVVFLGFFVPLSFFVTMAARMDRGIQDSISAFAIWAACVSLSLFAHVLVMRFKPLRFLYERPSWARITPMRTREPDSPRSTASA